MTDSAAEPLPVSLVAHTVFCPRRTWLEAAGEKAESVAMERGYADHKRVDSRADDRTAKRRSVDITGDSLGIVGRCDVLEEVDGGVRVVEFKAAPLRGVAEVTPAQEIQLALQGVCLEDMGQRVVGYAVHFTTQRRTVDVVMTDEIVNTAKEFVELTREIVNSAQAPPPLVNDRRCGRCSHIGVCLPDENRSVAQSRVVATDPDGQVLHLTVPGSRASLRSGRVVISKAGEELASVPLERVQGLVVHGNADLSSALVRELLWRRVAVVWASFRGQVVGFARSADSPNGAARVAQANLDDGSVRAVSCEMISAKIANQATQLRRSARGEVVADVRLLRDLSKAALEAPDGRYLLGIEGKAAALYFAKFPSMLNDDKGSWFADTWSGRVGRGAGDPLNVALNIAYGALLSDVIRAVVACGLDPHIGLLHSSNRNKPALALDLMEQFRPVVADSAVLTAVNNGELKPSMFVEVMGSFRITDAGRRVVLAAYGRRVEQEFRHSAFGYQVTWRRAMEVQARMLLSMCDGTRSDYQGVRTR